MHNPDTVIYRPADYPIFDILAKMASLWPVYRTPFGTFGQFVNGSALRAISIKILSALRAISIKILSALRAIVRKALGALRAIVRKALGAPRAISY